MRKILVLTVVITLFTLNSFGGNHNLGIVIQPKYSNLADIDFKEGINVKLSYEVGLKYAVDISSNLCFDVRLLYSSFKFDVKYFTTQDWGDPIFESPIQHSFQYITSECLKT